MILDIINNYGKMSFNYGPTLMSWLEVHAPYTYERIIRADVESAQEFSGHGNAMAQVYNHIIMPLANRRDKITQVVWGIEDFKYRYGRMPEGMWLAETAVNDETLEVLADNGIKFTVLSPFQAKGFRKFGEKNYVVLNVEIPDVKKCNAGGTVGIDLGIKDFYICNDGVKCDNPKYLAKSAKKLAKEQRKNSRFVFLEHFNRFF